MFDDQQRSKKNYPLIRISDDKKYSNQPLAAGDRFSTSISFGREK